MSRKSAISTTLQAPGRFEPRSVEPSGDCFFECLHLQLPLDGREMSLTDVGAMREAVAAAMTQETFEIFRIADGYDFMRARGAPGNLEELRSYVRRRGSDTGPGQCFWAEDFAIQTCSSLARVKILIIDDEAVSRGSRSGRRRGGDTATDGRFVALGEPSRRCVLLHRSRRQHYNPVFFDGQGCWDIDALPGATRALWGAALAAPAPALANEDLHSRKRPREAAVVAGEDKGDGRRCDADPAPKPCPACTFENSPLLDHCEMCSTPL